MTRDAYPRNERIKAGVGAALFQALLAWALITGLAVRPTAALRDSLKLIGIATVPPPPPIVRIVPQKSPARKREGAASPPNLRAKASEIVAPPLPVPMPPPPIAAAPVRGIGAAPSAGAAPIPGPGTGAGGQGNGTGSGRGGNGDGGGGDGDERGPVLLKGMLSGKNYPRAAMEAGIGGTVTVMYTVEVNGRATGCHIVHSSGNADLDQGTCQAIEQRYRFRPATDAQGRPVSSEEIDDHEWVPHDRPSAARPPPP
jgi:protein TonB